MELRGDPMPPEGLPKNGRQSAVQGLRCAAFPVAKGCSLDEGSLLGCHAHLGEGTLGL